MSKKVIVIWSIFIVIIGGIGLFGILNKDLIEDGGLPNDSNERKCSITKDNIKVAYDFILETGSILKTDIKYYNTDGNETDYNLLSSFSNNGVNGITSTLYGKTYNYNAVVSINNSIFKEIDLTNKEELKEIGLVISSTSSYKSYKENIQSLSDFEVVCD